MGRARNKSAVEWVQCRDGIKPMMRFTFQKTRVREWLPYPDTPTNRKAADAFADGILEKVRKGTLDYAREFPDSPNLALFVGEVPTVEEAFAKWLKTYEAGNIKIPGQPRRKPAPSTLYNHKRQALMWQELLGKGRRITALRYAQIEDAISSYPWTEDESHFNNCLDTLRMVIKYWRKTYPVLPDLYDGTSCEATQKRASESDDERVDPFSAEARDRILEDLAAHYDERVAWYFWFQFYTGARPNETVALLWTETELGGTPATIRIRRSRTYHGTREGRAKTKKSIRIVELSDKAREALVAMRKYTGLKDHGHVFEDPRTGQPWQSGQIPRQRYWNSTLTRLKLAHRTAYTCRHTWATLAIMGGLPHKWIATQMGTSLEQLDRVYASWLHKADRGDQIKRLNEYENMLKQRGNGGE